MTEGRIRELLKDMEHGDQDNREMAASDLMSEIEKGAKLEPGLERSVCQAYTKQLSDTSLAVQSNAVKCISKIASKVSEKNFGEIANKLTECILKGTADFRDIYTTCLKTLINEADETFGKTLCACILGPVVKGTAHKQPLVKDLCVEITLEVLKRFSGVLLSNPSMIDKEGLKSSLLGHLGGLGPAQGKRICACIGALAVVLAPKQLADLIAALLRSINPKDRSKSFAFIDSLGAIVATVGYKLAPNLSAIVRVFKDFCKPKPPQDPTPTDLDNDLKEVCLIGFEHCVKKCPKEIAEHIDEILKLALELLGYEPNYNPDVEMVAADAAEFAEWGEGVAEEPRIEDDSSWKVRRGASRVLATLVRCRHDKIKRTYDVVLPQLTKRLRERDESIKCTIINTFSDLIQGVVVGNHTTLEDLESPLPLERTVSAEPLLEALPSAISELIEHYKDRSSKVREAIASVFLHMAIAVPDRMNGEWLGRIFPGLLINFKENSAPIKILVLQTLRRLARTSLSADGYIANLQAILQVLTIAIHDDYYKVPAEGFKTAAALVRLLMIEPSATPSEAKAAITSIFKLCSATFSHVSEDQEIKQGVISTVCAIVATASDLLTPKELDTVMVIWQERMKHETLRLPTMKALHAAVTANKKLSIAARLEQCLPDILQMTHLISRQVKVAALETLQGMCERYPEVALKAISSLVSELVAVLKDNDLQVVQISLKILARLLASAVPEALESVLSAILALCQTPLIQPVLEEATVIVTMIAARNKGRHTPAAVCEALWKRAQEKTFRSVAAIVASVVLLREDYILPAIDHRFRHRLAFVLRIDSWQMVYGLDWVVSYF